MSQRTPNCLDSLKNVVRCILSQCESTDLTNAFPDHFNFCVRGQQFLFWMLLSDNLPIHVINCLRALIDFASNQKCACCVSSQNSFQTTITCQVWAKNSVRNCIALKIRQKTKSFHWDGQVSYLWSIALLRPQVRLKIFLNFDFIVSWSFWISFSVKLLAKVEEWKAIAFIFMSDLVSCLLTEDLKLFVREASIVNETTTIARLHSFRFGLNFKWRCLARCLAFKPAVPRTAC